MTFQVPTNTSRYMETPAVYHLVQQFHLVEYILRLMPQNCDLETRLKSYGLQTDDDMLTFVFNVYIHTCIHASQSEFRNGLVYVYHCTVTCKCLMLNSGFYYKQSYHINEPHPFKIPLLHNPLYPIYGM